MQWLETNNTMIYIYHYYAEIISCGQSVASLDGIAQTGQPVECYKSYTRLKDDIMATVEDPPIDPKIKICSMTLLSSNSREES